MNQRSSFKVSRRLIFFVCLVALAACPTFAAAKDPSRLVVALNQEFETLNPLVNSMMASIMVQDTCIRPLVGLTPDVKAVPILIKTIPSTENGLAKLIPGQDKGKNGLQVDFEFRPEAKWGDGTPLSCRDVEASWQIGLSEKVTISNREIYSNIESVKYEEASPQKCRIVYKEARWDFYLNLPKPVPAHLELPIFKRFVDQAHGYERNSLFVTKPSTPGLYNGPYLVAEIKPGSHILLKPNPHFHGKQPNFKSLLFRFIVNTATLEANLRAGNVDMLSSAGLTLDQALAFEKKAKKDNLPYKVVLESSMTYQHVDLNMANPILQDLRIRKALFHALDRNEMVKAFFEGRIEPAHSFASKFDSYYSPQSKDLVLYNYSRQKAAKYFDEAGWKLGKDGIRYKDGKKLSLRLSTAAENRFLETLVVYIQDSLKKVGVEILVKNFPPRVLFPEIIRKRQFDLALYAFVNDPDASVRSMLHSKMIPSEQNAWSGINRPGWTNLQVDDWLDEIEKTFDRTKRIELMKKVLRAYTEELPALPLFFRANSSVVPKGLKNYRMSPHAHSEYLEVENWEI